MENALYLIFLALVVAFIVRGAMRRRSASSRVLTNPKVGIFTFGDDEAAALALPEDEKVYRDLFNQVEVHTVNSSTDLVRLITEGEFDIAHCLVPLDHEGQMITATGTMEPIKNLFPALNESSVSHILFALSTDQSAMGGLPHAKKFRQNLVLTLDRNGQGFPDFLRKLYTLCREGKPFGEAWVALHPQDPNLVIENAPGCFMMYNAPHVLLGPRA